MNGVMSPRLLLWAGVALTAAIWALVIFGTPVAVRWLPADFFSNPAHLAPRRRKAGESRVAFWALFLLRHLAGVALIVLGTVFLQGVLVVIAGLAIMDIPGKGTAVRRLAAIGFVWRLMARIRAKASLPPLEPPARLL